MKRKNYTSLQEIKLDLQRLNLERKINLEELKLTKYRLKEDLSPANWIGTLLKGAKKFGPIILMKKLIRQQ
jgi:hypothetical protein